MFDFLELWLDFMAPILKSSGILLNFGRSPRDRGNPSFFINLRYDDNEADLLIWESGVAEFAVGDVNGEVTHVHFDNVKSRESLQVVFSGVTKIIALKGA